MNISSLEIRNFRGIDINLDKINNIVSLIGQNDSGKSNLCAAILKVLDFDKRKLPLQESDSTMGNRKDIFIKVGLEITDLSNEQLAIVHEIIHEKGGKKYIYAQLTSKFNSDVLIYEDELLLGDPDIDSKEYNIMRQNPLDKILSIIYINPTYDTKQETRNFFQYKEKKNIEDNRKLSDEFEEAIKALNVNVKNEEALSEILEDINNLGKFEKMFDGLTFELVPNIRLDNIYKSLEISTLDSDGNTLSNIGDGKSKIFSMLLKEKTYADDRKKIIIVEEPENHLYVLLQKYYIDSILSFNPCQMIITTHSPYVVDFEKTNQVIKLDRYYDESLKQYKRRWYSYNINNEEFKKYGYLLNVEIAEMMYYDKVLLVEGESEKYFYSYLLSSDQMFRDYIFENKIGIFNVNGISFENTKLLLESLGVKVYLKTDNDVFKVPRQDKKIYAGITRCIKYLNESTKKSLQEILKFDDLNIDNFKFSKELDKIQVIEDKMEDICNLLRENGILFSKHHLGFEKDFLDFINYTSEDYMDIVEELKQAKLMNLHEFISDNDIVLSINESNKNSILVEFIYD